MFAKEYCDVLKTKIYRYLDFQNIDKEELAKMSENQVLDSNNILPQLHLEEAILN